MKSRKAARLLAAFRLYREGGNLETVLLLAGLRFRFCSERPLILDTVLEKFLIPAEVADVTVFVSWDWEQFTLPDVPLLGEDLICRYYRQGDTLYCLTRGGSKGPVACSVYGADRREIRCFVNEKPFRMPPDNLGSILRMIPMREIFRRFHAVLLHASQISFGDRGILFAAPSGTGKTTQAKLWRQYRSAEIICNDRTLVRKSDSLWHAYGYPMDGSEPVRSSSVNILGAIVLLEQGSVNTVKRLGPSKALPRLMSQAVLDCWNGEARSAVLTLLMSLMEEIPVYLMTCTPDERAVETLETKLIEDEVISVESDIKTPLV